MTSCGWQTVKVGSFETTKFSPSVRSTREKLEMKFVIEAPGFTGHVGCEHILSKRILCKFYDAETKDDWSVPTPRSTPLGAIHFRSLLAPGAGSSKVSSLTFISVDDADKAAHSPSRVVGPASTPISPSGSARHRIGRHLADSGDSSRLAQENEELKKTLASIQTQLRQKEIELDQTKHELNSSMQMPNSPVSSDPGGLTMRAADSRRHAAELAIAAANRMEAEAEEARRRAERAAAAAAAAQAGTNQDYKVHIKYRSRLS